MRGKIKPMDLLIITRKLKKPKKKIKLNRDIEKEHIEKEKEEDYMVNTDFLNSRFSK
tara:strand:- start:7454 stop:7624 length:171 start_codon:yes stop_codon:yes gene_type:complete